MMMHDDLLDGATIKLLRMRNNGKWFYRIKMLHCSDRFGGPFTTTAAALHNISPLSEREQLGTMSHESQQEEIADELIELIGDEHLYD